MARIIAGVASSHVPAIGAAIDNKQTEEPYWQRVFSGFERSKEWMAKAKPDVAIVVYSALLAESLVLHATPVCALANNVLSKPCIL